MTCSGKKFRAHLIMKMTVLGPCLGVKEELLQENLSGKVGFRRGAKSALQQRGSLFIQRRRSQPYQSHGLLDSILHHRHHRLWFTSQFFFFIHHQASLLHQLTHYQLYFYIFPLLYYYKKRTNKKTFSSDATRQTTFCYRKINRHQITRLVLSLDYIYYFKAFCC